LLAVSTVFAAERWLRGERRFQFSIAGILCVTAATGGLLVLSRDWELPYRDFNSENATMYWALVSTNDLMHPIRWPSVIALAITLYVAAWLALRVFARLSARTIAQ
jgi:hypothetical protein